MLTKTERTMLYLICACFLLLSIAHGIYVQAGHTLFFVAPLAAFRFNES
jgi:hypothetical protein